MARNKTQFRHIAADGSKVRVTEENGSFFIGNSDERAEGKMMHHKGVQQAHNHSKSDRMPHQLNNPFYGQGQGEWDDYAHTSDDL